MPAKPQVLVIAFAYPPDNYSGALRPYRLVKYLERLGYPVTVLAASGSHQPEVDGVVHRVRGEAEFQPRKDLSAFLERVSRKLLFPVDGGSVWALRAMRYARRWMSEPSRPVVFSTFPPAGTHLAAYWLKRKYNLGWVADFRDPFAGASQRRLWRSRYFASRFESAIFQTADAVIATTDALADIWRSRYPAFRDKIHVIWNGFDPEEQLVARPLPERNYKVLAHVGEIYGARHPGSLLASLDRLSRDGTLNAGRLRLQFIGPLERSSLPDPALLDRLISSGLVECTTERISRSEAQQRMSTADYLLLLDMLHGAAGIQLPAKFFEYVCIGRPILACTTRGSVTDRVMAASGIPHVCTYADDSQAEVDRKVLAFLALPSEPVGFSEEFRSMFEAMPQAVRLAEILDGARRRACQ